MKELHTAALTPAKEKLKEPPKVAGNKVKILILEHDPIDTGVLKKELDRSFGNYTLQVVRTEKDFKQALHVFAPNIILSDYLRPTFNWDDAFKLKQKISPGIPFLLIAGAMGAEDALHCIKTGVTDCVFSDKPDSLVPKIKQALEAWEKNEVKRTEEETLQKNISNLRAMFDNTDVGFLFLNAEYKVVAYNHIICHWAGTIFGAELKENANLRDLLLPDRLAAFSTFKASISSGKAITYETSYPKKDGSMMWLIINAKPIMDKDKVIGTCLALTDITAQKAAEETLKHSEQYHRALIENISDAILLINENTQVIYQSPSTQRISGYAIEDMKGTNVFEFIHPDDVQNCMAFFQKVFANPGVPMQNVYRLRHKLGHYIWIEGTITNLFHDEDVKAFIVNYRDVTQRVEDAEKLKLNETRLKKAQEVAHLGSWELDFATGIALWSEESCRIYGLDLKDNRQTFEVWKSFIHPDDLDFVMKLINKSQQSLTDGAFEHRIVRRDGTIRNIHSESKFEFDVTGKPTGLFGIAHDVTEKIAARELLRQSETKLRTIFETEPECVKILNSKGELLDMNPAGLAMLEADNLEQVLGKSILPFIDPKFRRAHAALISDVFKGNTNMMEFEIKGLKGTPKWVETHAVPMKDAEGKIISMLAVTRNITERKRIEQEIKNLNENLEQRIKERTAELTEANAALETFSYSVSHDLRSPIRAVMGFTRIINKEYGKELSGDLKEMFSHIESSSKRMSSIIDDLLLLAKWGKEKMKLKEVDMNALFRRVWDNVFFESHHQASLEMTTLPNVQADASMLEQVIINLLSNAVKYSSKMENPAIKIGFEERDGEIVFHVTDNGAGFDMKHYDRLFGAFQRLHSVSEFEGTGVGLLLVKRIVEKHRGTVWAEGKVNEGATFYFTLPVQ